MQLFSKVQQTVGELHYYTGKEYRYAGYTYLIKFKNGKATVAADFAGSNSTATSKYELKKDQRSCPHFHHL